MTLVDISPAALDVVRERLGERGRGVTRLAGDARRLCLAEPVDVWHDRAVFHFLTQEIDQAAYMRSLRAALRVGGHVIMATFGLEGPDRCSGLPVERYDADKLSRRLGPDFEYVRSLDRPHVTPSGAVQVFTYCVFKRRR